MVLFEIIEFGLLVICHCRVHNIYQSYLDYLYWFLLQKFRMKFLIGQTVSLEGKNFKYYDNIQFMPQEQGQIIPRGPFAFIIMSSVHLLISCKFLHSDDILPVFR